MRDRPSTNVKAVIRSMISPVGLSVGEATFAATNSGNRSGTAPPDRSKLLRSREGTHVCDRLLPTGCGRRPSTGELENARTNAAVMVATIVDCGRFVDFHAFFRYQMFFRDTSD